MNEIKVSNTTHEFNEKWDDKLNILLTEGEVVKVMRHRIKFRLKSGKFSIAGVPLWNTYDFYTVWLGFDTNDYAHLYYFNDKSVPEEIQYKPSQSTMNKLHELEKELRYSECKRAYE